MLSSLASKYSPRNLDDLPWRPTEKEQLRLFVHEMAHNRRQTMYLIVGAAGSGKSLLLHSLLIPLYLQEASAALDARDFFRNYVFVLSRFRQEQQSLANFVQLYTPPNLKRFVLVDDLDLCSAQEVSHLLGAGTGSFCCVATCRDTSRLHERVVRFARCLHLPAPEFHDQVAQYFERVIAQAELEPATTDDLARRLWIQGGQTFSGMYKALDLWLLTSLPASFSEEETVQQFKRALRSRVPQQAVAAAEEFISRGYSLSDFISLLWSSVSRGDPEDAEDDFLVRRILNYMTSPASRFRSSRTRQEILEFVYKIIDPTCMSPGGGNESKNESWPTAG